MAQRFVLTAHTTARFTITCTPPADDPDWDLTDAAGLVFMAKERATDADADAILTMSLGAGIELDPTDVTDRTLILTIADTDWPESVPESLHWGLMGRDALGRRQLAKGTITVSVPVPLEAPE